MVCFEKSDKSPWLIFHQKAADCVDWRFDRNFPALNPHTRP